jgi:hypothetical protein
MDGSHIQIIITKGNDMYKVGYKAYGIEVINVIWPQDVKKINGRWVLIFARYYVRTSPFKYVFPIALMEYQLTSLLESKKYEYERFTTTTKKILTNLMLE